MFVVIQAITQMSRTQYKKTYISSCMLNQDMKYDMRNITYVHWSISCEMITVLQEYLTQTDLIN